METFNDYLNTIENKDNRKKLKYLLAWIEKEFPNLEKAIKWNTPMFVDHGTYIIGLSVAKAHIAINPEPQTMNVFREQIETAGYSAAQSIFRIKWDQDIDYDLLRAIIGHNIDVKKDYTSFWQKGNY